MPMLRKETAPRMPVPTALAKRFFGGKAFGEVVDGFARLRKFKQLFRSEDAPGKRLSEFLFKRMMRLRETMSVPMP